MAIRKLKPMTPGQRHKVIGSFETITSSAQRSLRKVFISLAEEINWTYDHPQRRWRS